MNDITHLLSAASDGDESAAQKLLPLIYEELRKLARYRMANEAPGQTLQPTALVHDAWLRLGADQQTNWQNRAHFFAAAAEAMRRILIERAERKRAIKRGGGQVRVELDEGIIAAPDDDDRLLAMNEALEKLAKVKPEIAEIVRLRYFVGLKIEETAEILRISEATVKRHWTYAKAWLQEEMDRTR